MRTSKLLTTCFVALLSAQCFAVAHAQTEPPAQAGSSTKSRDVLTSQDFVTKAAQSNFAEIDVSQLAQSKAHSQDVKDFAKRMIDDHSKANSQLAQLAKPKDLKVPLSPDMTHKATMQMLHLKSGESFDKAYMEQMDKDHQKAIELFQSAASSPQVDEDLQAFASKTLPTLQEHHQLVAQVESKMPSRSASKPATDSNR